MLASEYKKLTSAAQPTETVKLPSGATFEMRLAPIQQWTATGILPASLAAKMHEAATAKDEKSVAEHILRTFTEEDFVKQQSLATRMMEFCCVEPKVSVSGDDPDALRPEDIDPFDFQFLMKWMWSGGKAGEELAGFRPGSKQRPVAGDGRKGFRSAPKRAARNKK